MNLFGPKMDEVQKGLKDLVRNLVKNTDRLTACFWAAEIKAVGTGWNGGNKNTYRILVRKRLHKSATWKIKKIRAIEIDLRKNISYSD
jgi:hypothetical protein